MNLKRSLIVPALAFLLTNASVFAAQEKYQLDPLHTTVNWKINHFDFSNPSGKFALITGSLNLDPNNITSSSVKAKIPLTAFNTGIAKLDEHLMGPDFFDVKKYPYATFESFKVEPLGEKEAKLYGKLNLHGITKEVVLNVHFNKSGVNMFGKQTVGFSAKATINRSDFGIDKYTPGLGDEINLEIDSEANLKIEKGQAK